MIDLIEAEPAAVKRRRVSRRLVVFVALAVVLVTGGAITAVAVSFHYLHARGLEIDGGGWLAPDKSRSVNAGQYSASIAAPRFGQPQTFELDLYNPSTVSQTVLGLTDAAELADHQQKAEPEHLVISTTSVLGHESLTYTTKPVVVPPHGEYSLRLTHDTGGAATWGTSGCRSESWDSISLQVRVGAFTRTEIVKFANGQMIMELQGQGTNC